jgi:pimeloyl-ACP methyl ester carboxylesterase
MDLLLCPKITMINYQLQEIITSDNMMHQGIYFAPQHKSDTAILWVHGLSSNYYGARGLYDHIIDAAGNVGFATFNNRGHDGISGIKKIDKTNVKGYIRVNGGAGYENFKDCIYDIDAGISFLIKQGFKKIILCGHSTGANKVCYYCGSQQDPRVAGAILASPVSDRLMAEKMDKELKVNLHRMQNLVEKGEGDLLLNNLTFMPLTPKRYLSLFAKNTLEDVFDYGDKIPKLKFFSKITCPLMVVFGQMDEAADRPVTDIKKVFDSHTNSNKYSSIIIENSPHGFDGKENKFAKVVVNWIKEIVNNT